MKKQTISKIKTIISSLADEDRKLRSLYMDGKITGEELDKLDNSNTYKVFQKVVEEYGLITISEFGSETSHDAWLLVQHMTDYPEFMSKYLLLMEENLDDINKPDYALLKDRILLVETGFQIFGTQVSPNEDNSAYMFLPIKEIDGLEKRRKKFELPTLNSFAETIMEKTGKAVIPFEQDDRG